MQVDNETLAEILNKIDDSMNEIVAQQKFKDWGEMESFLDMQYESRLESVLRGKGASVNGLDSEMKKILVGRKDRLFNHLKQALEKEDT